MPAKQLKEHIDAEIRCNALQSLFITHVMESEWGRNEEMDELARSMRHSRRVQQQTYDCRKSSAKIRCSRCGGFALS